MWLHDLSLPDRCGKGDDPDHSDKLQEIFVGGTEGVFRVYPEDGTWKTEHLLDVPTSDIVFEDLDGDGEEELAVIEEFHGNRCAVFKRERGEWKRYLEFPMQFGHVLWGGNAGGTRALITGSRAGDRELVLRRLSSKEGGLSVAEEIVIDKGQAPAQITVTEENGRTVILAANHGMGQAVLYRLLPDPA